MIFKNSEKIAKKFPKNVKFGLQAHFNTKKTLEGSNQLFEL